MRHIQRARSFGSGCPRGRLQGSAILWKRDHVEPPYGSTAPDDSLSAEVSLIKTATGTKYIHVLQVEQHAAREPTRLLVHIFRGVSADEGGVGVTD